MAWSIVGVGTVAETTTTTLTLTEPAGVADGDLLVACIASRTTATTPVTNTGWLPVGFQNNNNTLTTTSAVASGTMLYQRRSGTPDLTFVVPSGVSVSMGRIVAYRGTDRTNPLVAATAFTTAVNTTAVSGTGLTTIANGDLIVAMAAGGQEATWSSFAATTPSGASGATDTSTAPSTTWAERADSNTVTGADASLGIFDALRSTAGATGNLTVTASQGASHVVVAAAFTTSTVTASSIVFDATDTDNTTKSPTQSYTFPLTVAAAAGAERLVLVGLIGNSSDGDFTSVTIDGLTATRVGTVSRGANDGSGVAAVVMAYRAPGTASTSINVVATYDGSTNCFAGYCAGFKLFGAATSALATTNAAVNDPSLNTNTATGGMAAAALVGYTSATPPTVTWTGLTERWDAVRVFGDDIFSGACDDITTGASPRTISADTTLETGGTTGDSVASICVSFSPSNVVPAATTNLLTASVGTVTVSLPISITATTNLATSSVGTVTVAVGTGVSTTAATNLITSSVGDVTVATVTVIDVTASPTGVEMTSTVGSVLVSEGFYGPATLLFDATDADNATIGNNSTYTFPLTVNAATGEERLVLIAGIGRPTMDFDACTIDGQTATRVGEFSRGTTDSNNACSFITAYRAPGTANTTINVVVTADGPSIFFSGYCACFLLTKAGDLFAQINATTNDPVLNIAVPTDGTTVAGLLAYEGSVPTVTWTGLTERFDGVQVFGTEVFSGASLDVGITSSLTIQADISGTTITPPSANDSVAAICLSFGPVGASGSAVTGEELTMSVGDVTVTTTRIVVVEVTGLQMAIVNDDAIWVLDPPEFRSVSSTAFGGGFIATVDAPIGVAEGDILIATMVFLRSDTDGTVSGPPTGFTAIAAPTLVTVGGNFHFKMQMWWKRATSSEPATYTFHHEAFYMYTQLVMAAYSDALQAEDPIELYSTASGSGTTSSATSITTALPNGLLILGGHNTDTDGSSPPSGMTERFDDYVTLYDEEWPIPGATGTITHTPNGSLVGGVWQSWLVSLLAARALSPNVFVTGLGMTASVGEALGLTGALYGWDISSLTGVGVLSVNDTVLTAGPSDSPTSVSSTMTHGGGLYYAEVTITGDDLDGVCGFYNESADEGVQIDLATGDIIERPSGTRTPMFDPIVSGDVIGLAFSKVSPVKVWLKVNDGVWNGDPAQAPDSTGIGLWEIPPTAGITSAVEDLVAWPYQERVQDPAILLYEGYDIPYTILVATPNVTFRNCRFYTDAYYGIACDEVTGTTIDHCTIYTAPDNVYGAAGVLAGSDYTITNCDISGFENGIFFGSNGTISNNYIHGLSNLEDAHTDGIQTVAASDVMIDNNWIESRDTSTIFMKVEITDGTLSEVTIENNTLIAAEGQTFANTIYALPFVGTISGLRINSNRMEEGVGEYIDNEGGRSTPECFFNIDYFTSEPILTQFSGYVVPPMSTLTASVGLVHVYPVEPTAPSELVLSMNYVGISSPPPVAAPVRRSHNVSAFERQVPLILAKPTGTAEDDLMLATMFHVLNHWQIDGGTVIPQPVPPAGWAQFGETVNTTSPNGAYYLQHTTWHKRAGASEPSAYEWTNIPTGRVGDQWMQTFIGSYMNVSEGLAAFDGSTYSTGTSTTITGASVFTTQPDDLLIYFGWNDAMAGLVPPTSSAPPAGMTEIVDDVLYVAEESIPGTGATGDRFHAQLHEERWAVLLVALRGA